jgi:alanyl-tRNA synthetase
MDENKPQSQVNALYMEQSNLLNHRAKVTKVGAGEINKKKYQWIELNETIFHPKGGGQPCDEGMINGIKVAYVHKLSLDKNRVDLFEILHCFEENQVLPFKVGDEIELIVDEFSRKLYSQMHTAGHLLAEVVKMVFPELEAHHGNHDPKDGYVKFKMLKEINYEKEEIKQRVQPELDEWIQKDLPVIVTRVPSGMRAIQFCNYVMTCGGTHVNHLKEIGRVSVTDVSINKKEKIITVKYSLLS